MGATPVIPVMVGRLKQKQGFRASQGCRVRACLENEDEGRRMRKREKMCLELQLPLKWGLAPFR